MNKPNPKNRKTNKIIEDLIVFIEKAAICFTSSSFFIEQHHQNSDEDHLTEILCWHYNEEDRQNGEKYIFMPQPNQEGKRKVDIGIGLHDGRGNYIFCIEAKILPPTSEYITNNTGAIKRFKKCEHGLSSSNPNNKKALSHNAIVAYVKSDSFEKYFVDN